MLLKVIKKKKSMHKRITNILPRDKKKRTISVLGLTFKPNTDDMRDSPSQDIIPALIKQNLRLEFLIQRVWRKQKRV